ncbi:MAG: RNA recognition motif domain-containing protein [Anaerolineae bacterium]
MTSSSKDNWISVRTLSNGAIKSLAWITDRDPGRFRGFCFIEMDDSSANAAILRLNGADVGGRSLRVNEARPREERVRPGSHRRDNRQDWWH